MGFARVIVESDEASRALDSCRGRFERFEALWEGWSWRLARDPSRDAILIPGTDPPMYLIKSADFSTYGLPSAVTFLYFFDDEQVTIVDLKVDVDENGTTAD